MHFIQDRLNKLNLRLQILFMIKHPVNWNGMDLGD